MPSPGRQKATPQHNESVGVCGEEKMVCQVSVPWSGSANDDGGVF